MKASDRIFDNLDFTHKMHEKQAELMSFGSIALRVLLLCSLLLSLGIQMLQPVANSNFEAWNVVSILSTLLGVGLSFYQLNFNYDKLLDLHRVTAKKLLNVKNRMIVAREGSVSQKQLDAFVQELNLIYESAPQTGWLAKKFVNNIK
jgi:hypothetical protein